MKLNFNDKTLEEVMILEVNKQMLSLAFKFLKQYFLIFLIRSKKTSTKVSSIKQLMRNESDVFGVLKPYIFL